MMKKISLVYTWVLALFLFSVLFVNSVDASTNEFMRNGDFESGNVMWNYDLTLVPPIIENSFMDGQWFGLLGYTKELDWLVQTILLPSDATSILFTVDVFVDDDPNFTGANTGFGIFDKNTGSLLEGGSFPKDQDLSGPISIDLTEYRGKTIDIFFANDDRGTNSTETDPEVWLGVDNVSILATVPDTVPVYRLYSPARRSNHFTTSTAERDKLVAAGWTLEGIAYDVYASPTGHVPVYRLYSSARGANHFTTSVSERDKLIAAGWFLEGVAYYVSSSPTDHNPVYRLYSSAQSRNHFTQSIAERDKLTGVGWIYEGIAYYVPK